MADLDISVLLDGTVVQHSSTVYALSLPDGEKITFQGLKFTYDHQGIPNGGTITGFNNIYAGQHVYDVTNISVPVATFVSWAVNGDTAGALLTVLAGSDTLIASDTGNRLYGLYGDDLLTGGTLGDYLDGGPGNNTVHGGAGGDVIAVVSGVNILDGDAGDDTIVGGTGQDAVRGLDDNDSIDGGADADDLNGNKGQDTVHGGEGADFVRGGQGNDLVFGDGGDDVHVNGNIGSDTVHGGFGADSVFGGQGDDQVFGDDGDDYLSGDLGSDTLTGGSGGDTFHLGFNSGHDVVADFIPSQGDRVLLDHGAAYTVSQSGADALVTLATGEQLTLQGVTASTLPDGWIAVS